VWIKNSVGTKTGNWRNFGNVVKYVSSSRIEVITIEDTADIGGDLYLYVSTDGGTTWTKERTLIKGRFIDPIYVKDYDSDARMIFVEYAALPLIRTRKAYLWGDSGFIKGSISNFGTVVKEIKETYNGTLVNTPTLVAGKYGGGIQLVAASSQYVQMEDNDVFSFDVGSPDHPFTLSFWINVDDTNVTQAILTKYTTVASQCEYACFLQSNTITMYLYIAAATSSIKASAPFTTTGQWVFVCVTYDGGGAETGIKVFLNAIESQTVQSETGTYTEMTNTTSKVYIGRRNTFGSYLYLNGSLDEVKIWDKVLSEPEIALEIANTL
jgi:hypothetical protein